MRINNNVININNLSRDEVESIAVNTQLASRLIRETLMHLLPLQDMDIFCNEIIIYNKFSNQYIQLGLNTGFITLNPNRWTKFNRVEDLSYWSCITRVIVLEGDCITPDMELALVIERFLHLLHENNLFNGRFIVRLTEKHIVVSLTIIKHIDLFQYKDILASIQKKYLNIFKYDLLNNSLTIGIRRKKKEVSNIG